MRRQEANKKCVGKSWQIGKMGASNPQRQRLHAARAGAAPPLRARRAEPSPAEGPRLASRSRSPTTPTPSEFVRAAKRFFLPTRRHYVGKIIIKIKKLKNPLYIS